MGALSAEAQSVLTTILSGIEPHGQLPTAVVSDWRSAQVDMAIAARIGAGADEVWPPAARERLHATRRAATAVDLLQQRVTRLALDALSSADVSVLMLKGMALAHTVYAASHARPRGDVDLLVGPGQLAAAIAALSKAGFHLEAEMSSPWITRQRHLSFGSTQAVVIDLHQELFNLPFLDRVPDFSTLSARSHPIAALGAHAFGLSFADALVHAAIHRIAHHNSSDNLLWLLDVHLLSGALDAAEWALVDRVASAAGACIALADTLTRAHDTLGTRVPPGLLERWRSVRGEPLAELVGAQLTEIRLQSIIFRHLPDARSRAAFLAAHLLPPAPYMLRSYATTARWRLPELYARRIAAGALKWMRVIPS